jgi:DNA-binding GntR family transcriptional regulator
MASTKSLVTSGHLPKSADVKKSIKKISTKENSTSLSEQAYQAIRRAIRQRRFRSGDRLRENELAEMLGFSRTPVREALGRLQVEGLAAENGQRGFMIVEFDHVIVTELFVMREVLEGTAAKLATRNAQDTEISWIRYLHDQYSDLVNSDKSAHLITEKNRQFHEALSLCAHNRFLLRMLEPIHDALGLLGESNLKDQKRVQDNLYDHEQIVKALESRDSNLAEESAKKHIQNAYAFRIKRMFEEAHDEKI